MAQDQVEETWTPSSGSNGWHQLTNANVTSKFGFQVKSAVGGVREVEIRYTADATEPAGTDSGTSYYIREGEKPQAMSALTALSGAVRVWARAAGGDTDPQAAVTFVVDHD